jgi:hypothetical protein
MGAPRRVSDLLGEGLALAIAVLGGAWLLARSRRGGGSEEQ